MITYYINVFKSIDKFGGKSVLLKTSFDSLIDIDLKLSNKITDAITMATTNIVIADVDALSIAIEKRKQEILSISDLTRTITLPPPDDGMRWSNSDNAYIECHEAIFRFTQIPIEPEKREYDWSKTGPDVHVGYLNGVFFPYKTIKHSSGTLSLADHWQAHDGGECPVDVDSCIVEVKQFDYGDVTLTILASKANWKNVYSWRFKELAKGVVWNLTEEKKEC